MKKIKCVQTHRSSGMALPSAIFSLFLITALAIVTSLALTLVNKEPSQPRYITFSSSATSMATPDSATANITITSTAKSVRQAAQELAIKTANMRKALIKNNVPSKDLSSANYNLSPTYSYLPNSSPLVTGYQASQNFTLTVEKIAQAGPLSDYLISYVGSSLIVNSITPILSSPTLLEAKARDEATRQAKNRAVAYAASLGVKLGELVSLSEDATPQNQFPIYATSAVMSPTAKSVPTQIDPGQSSSTVSVTVKYSIS